ncbi:MAG: hypothetical protein AAGB05_00625 [Pseudomonadota bacterium]
MIRIADIHEEHEYAAWLAEVDLPVAPTLCLAFRAAVRRSHAFWNDAPPLNMNNRYSPNGTVALRALLTCGIVSDVMSSGPPSRALRRAAANARYGTGQRDVDCAVAIHVAHQACIASTSRSASKVAEAMRDVRADTAAIVASDVMYSGCTWRVQHADCALSLASQDLYRTALYAGDDRSGGADARPTALDKVLTGWQEPWPGERFWHPGWQDAGPDWQFWHDWLRAVIDGTPMDPDLLMDIALIEDEIWRAGDAPVNQAIRTRYARDLSANPVA